MRKKPTWKQMCYRTWLRYRNFKPGMLYEDCACHPCICTEISIQDDNLGGISLIDGSAPRLCSLINCVPRKISLRQAVLMKERWKDRQELLKKGNWPPKAKRGNK